MRTKVTQRPLGRPIITGFQKIDLPAARKEMDAYDLEKFDGFVSNAGGCDLWALKVEVINLKKTTITGIPIIKSLFIEDDEGFQFPKCSHHFVNYTEFGENKKMNVFSGCYPPEVPFLPKVPTEGSIPFLLPKDQKRKYYTFMRPLKNPLSMSFRRKPESRTG